MTHSPISAFNLPDRLMSKADPELIAADQQFFNTIGSVLNEQLSELSDGIAELRLHTDRGGQEAMERDLQIHRLTARHRTLGRYGFDLCLGRMVIESTGEVRYIGRLGLTDKLGQHLLIDWRSPAAEPFFGATHTNSMGLISRRRYRWSRGQVIDYWDEAFTDAGLESPAALDDHSAFIASLGSSRSARMQDVLGTLQADQDAIIRAGSTGALVVDGGPGTGKTVVALHRAAYLLYSDPRLDRRHGGILIVGPHQPYLGYVADILPNLGEDSVRLCTISEFVPEGSVWVPESDPDIAALKASAAMVGAMETAIAFYEEPPTEEMIVETEWSQVVVSSPDWREAFESVEPGTPHNEAREQIWQELQRILVEKHPSRAVTTEVEVSLQHHRELRSALNRAWPLLEATDVVADLWSVPAYLQLCAPWLSADQVRSLQRANPQAWTDSDLPLLDAVRHRLGDSGSESRSRRRASALASSEATMAAVVEDLIAADDSELLVMSMLRGEDLQTALVDESALPQADPNELSGPFAHIVVDEAQELTDAQWQMLLRRCPSRSLTIVGDRAQARRGFSEGWVERLERIGLSNITVSTLSINYRTPSEIMNEAEPVIRQALPDANVPTSIRESGVPVSYGRADELEVLLGRWLSDNADGTACVIGEPAFLGSARVQSLTPTLAKGLEFDLVILMNPGAFGSGIAGAVDRYVAMTRATQQLIILGRVV